MAAPRVTSDLTLFQEDVQVSEEDRGGESRQEPARGGDV